MICSNYFSVQHNKLLAHISLPKTRDNIVHQGEAEIITELRSHCLRGIKVNFHKNVDQDLN